MTQQTLYDVAAELELFEFSQEYMDLLKEEAEIDLCDQWISMQESMRAMTYGSYLTEGYLMEEAAEEAVEEVKANNTQRKETFRGKVVNLLIKAYNFVIKFLRRIQNAWHVLLPKNKNAMKKFIEKSHREPFTTKQTEAVIKDLKAGLDECKVKPFTTQPAAPALAKQITFAPNVSQEMKDVLIRYAAFGCGDYIAIKSTGKEIQMDAGVKLARIEGVANDSVDDLANDKVITELRKKAKEEGIRVRLDGKHFDATIKYYEKMVEAYKNKAEKITTNQTKKDIGANMKGDQKSAEAAQKTEQQSSARAKTCAELSASLSQTCTLINAAYKYQKWFMDAVTGNRQDSREQHVNWGDDEKDRNKPPDAVSLKPEEIQELNGEEPKESPEPEKGDE